MSDMGRARGIAARMRAQADRWRALVADGVAQAERWANGIERLEAWMNADRAPKGGRGYLTPADERRAAVLLVHLLRDDHAAAAAIEHDGPVSSLALVKAVTVVFPESWLDPDTVIARAEDYARVLVESEHGLLDDEGD
ncbi:hypothetical protein IU443_25655 [Nocardia farcinica]|uniref:hypothetical protein n=1 Tax=Nocardia farcinica TaxID=37329 RepID=UPI0018942EAE|nr:hypothetical protein [Nocardia farcinica]MBF6393323.1 hypothetical protein [Nocardia farcinica]